MNAEEMNPEEYLSFLVRFWCDSPTGQHPVRWHGEVEQIQSGERWHFADVGDLLAFLQQAAGTPNRLMQSEWNNKPGFCQKPGL